MANSIVKEAPEATEQATCAHHWVIATPDGEMSLGKCKICGTEKEFPNSAEDGLWQRNVPQSRWTGRVDPKSFNSGY
ncbi:MAG: hypothetical protein M3P30_03330 [Chloroflexota bacterium]|nr:hypothetical protein [Chloroflexota bacterium]